MQPIRISRHMPFEDVDQRLGFERGGDRLGGERGLGSNADAGVGSGLLQRGQDIGDRIGFAHDADRQANRNARSIRSTSSVRPRLSMPRSRSSRLDKATSTGASALAVQLAHQIAHQRDQAAGACRFVDLDLADRAYSWLNDIHRIRPPGSCEPVASKI